MRPGVVHPGLLLLAAASVVTYSMGSSQELQGAGDVASRARDPRTSSSTCGPFWPHWPQGPDTATKPDVPFVKTMEDVVNTRSAPVPLDTYECHLLNPYGYWIEPANASASPKGAGFYVEIPKTGSTTFKGWFGHNLFFHVQSPMHSFIPSIWDQRPSLSFTVVREPLTRLVSAFGTVTHRVQSRQGKHPPAFLDFALGSGDEFQRFEEFVDFYLEFGDNFTHPSLRGRGSVYFHGLTQMWFVRQFPYTIDHVLRIESLSTDVLELQRAAEGVIAWPSKGLPKKNVNEGARTLTPETLVKARPEIARKAIWYLRQDYDCLQYPTPITASA